MRFMAAPSFIAIPHDLAGVVLDATEMRVWLVAATESVNKTILVNGSVPVDFQRDAAPKFFDRFVIRLHLEQNRADVIVGRGDQYFVPNHHGIHRVYGIVCGGSKQKTEVTRPVVGFK